MSKIRGIRCVAPVLDRSGYAEWSRNYISALIATGVPITINPVSFDKRLSEEDDAIKPLLKHINKPIDHNVVISWLTPNVAKSILDSESQSVLKVLFTLWETTNLPGPWPSLINNSADECWIAGPWSEKVFIDSGVTVPLKQFKYPINFDSYSIDDSAINKPFKDSTYLFYAISQWSERKNFADLLEAYWSEFTAEDDVALLIKTHISSNSPEEYAHLVNVVKSIKARGVYDSTAPVVLLTEMFSNEQILALHKICDCYVSTSRGEGLGLGILEAGLFENLVITTEFGEQSSYINSNRGYVCPHTLRPVSGMGNPLYTSSQYWAQPDLHSFAKLMRKAYEEGCQDGNKVKHPEGVRLKAHLNSKCSYSAVSSAILRSLEDSLEERDASSEEQE